MLTLYRFTIRRSGTGLRIEGVKALVGGLCEEHKLTGVNYVAFNNGDLYAFKVENDKATRVALLSWKKGPYNEA